MFQNVNVITAMITPFKADGSIDFDGALELVRYLIDNGTDGVVVCGTTGEGATIAPEEALALFRCIAKKFGQDILVMGNAGSNNTASAVSFIKEAEKTGVAAFLSIVPYYNKPNQEGCYQHFKAVAAATSLPILLYNVPGRTGGSIAPATVARLARECTNIAGIKEASGNLENVAEIARLAPAGFHIYSGDDSLTLPILSVGGCGVISVAAHLIGPQLQAMIRAYKTGDVQKARALHLQYLPVMKGLFCTTSPTPVKTCMRILGHPAGPFRLPMVEASAETKNFLMQMMHDAHLQD